MNISNDATKQTHRCPQCDKSFSQKSSLTRHIASVHEKKRPHRCPQCDKSFSTKVNLERHIGSVHEKKRPHQCHQCDKSFSLKSNLQCHIASVHEKKRPHRCPQCDESFSEKGNLKCHIASVHEKKRPQRCHLCDKSFSSKANLKCHVASVHEKKRPHRCPQCDESFSQKSNLKRHIESVHNHPRKDSSRPTLQLDPSDEGVFIDVQDVLGNVATHSTSPEAHDAIMRRCEFVASTPDDQRYDGYQYDVRPLRCVFFMVHPSSGFVLFPGSQYPRSLDEGAAIKILSIDAATFLSDDFRLFYIGSTPTQFGIEAVRVYHSHIAVVREDDHENLRLAQEKFKPLPKHQNALMYYRGNQARVSTRVQIGERSYPNSIMISICNNLKFKPGEVQVSNGTKIGWRLGKVGCPSQQCRFRAPSLHCLKIHYTAAHLALKLHSCHACHKNFSRKKTLNAHVAYAHDKKRPHMCPQCDKSFTEKCGLKRHIASVHEKKRPHGCSLCDKNFSLKSTLSRHIASIHEKKRPHRCHQCDKSFSLKSNLKSHVASVHEKQPTHRRPRCDKSISERSDVNRHIVLSAH